MVSRKREQSESGFYHICQRGVNHFDIFEGDDDRSYFLDLLKECSGKLGVEVHAWCLMSNHVHLLVRGDLTWVSATMRRIGSRYARFFNRRHKRSGSLFGGRFCSVCVETDAQLLAVVRYIHRNPIRHEESTLCGNYPWSSYGEYVTGAASTCQTEFVLGLFGGMSEFVRAHEEAHDNERHLDIDTIAPMGDEEARFRANRALSDGGFGVTAAQLGSLRRELRNRAIRLVREAVGCSARQIQRLTAIAYSVIKGAVESAPAGASADADCRLFGVACGALLPPLSSLNHISQGQVPAGKAAPLGS